MKAKHELADILELYLDDFLANNSIPEYKKKVLRDIQNCRTSYFGGHKLECDQCGHITIRYNSCGNRHCPKCQALDKERWIIKREQDLLPVTYFHVVFTVPHELNSLFLNNQAVMYNLLFSTAWSVLLTFFKDEKQLGAQGGMIAVLHTWGQNLSYHPHLHCIVPGGGITKSGNWKWAKSKGKFLFPVKALSKVFRARFMQELKKISKLKGFDIEKKFIDNLFKKNWVIYAKKPFENVNSTVEYLGRYTHKIAISNNRILQISDNEIYFRAKNYRNNAENYTAKLSAPEFLRRFCLHILPKKFRKVRHYGFLASRKKSENLFKIRIQLNAKTPEVKKLDKRSILQEKYGIDIEFCPCCKKGKMKIIEIYGKSFKFNKLE